MNKQEALERIVAQAGRGELVFPTNMAASLKLQQALDDPECHLEAAADMVLAEPLIAARLVAIANSVAYTRCGAHVSNVRKAVSVLGFKPLRALVAAIVVRQIAGEIADAALRQKAERLWQHCANVAALAKVIAREFTGVDAETAMFAGIVHEIDGFYLLSRATEFPSLLDDDPDDTSRESRALLARHILQTLKIPKLVTTAVESVFIDVSRKPPSTIGDVLSLANALAAVPSPLTGAADTGGAITAADLDYSVGDKSLARVLEASAEEIKALTEALLV